MAWILNLIITEFKLVLINYEYNKCYFNLSESKNKINLNLTCKATYNFQKHWIIEITIFCLFKLFLSMRINKRKKINFYHVCFNFFMSSSRSPFHLKVSHACHFQANEIFLLELEQSVELRDNLLLMLILHNKSQELWREEHTEEIADRRWWNKFVERTEHARWGKSLTGAG